MEFRHISVMFSECMNLLNIRPEGVYVDATLGGGGHASGICEKLNQKGILIGIDRDQDALNAASNNLKGFSCRREYVQSNYADIKRILKDFDIDGIHGALLDLGVSSFQLDNAERGFSYMKDAPLDMRMNRDDSFSARDVVNGYSERELTNIIRSYGEERWASRISSFIVSKRKQGEITSTGELVDVIKAAIPASARREGPHPAKRTFQAIRIEVNQELTKLKQAVSDFMDVLLPGGRLCIITFHSLEDRIVKEIINDRLHPCTCPKELPVCVCGRLPDIKKISRKPVVATKHELELNPRARSAKLRVIEKL